jgi:capsular polysaccharide biosynthesis protein
VRANRRRHGSNVLWCLRHYWWIVLACVLAGAAAPLLVAPSAPTYQADALIVARQLTVNTRVLPTLAESVFADGAVAAAVAQDPAVGGDTRGLLPDRLSVVAGQDSIALVVQARDTDPVTAARLADIAAAAFVAELSNGGSGIGDFTVQGPAVPPTTPLATFSDPLRAAIGALAGLLAGLGLVALVGEVRRPVVSSEDVEGAVDVPLLGILEPRRVAPGGYLGPRGVRGIATVTRWLATAPHGRLALISPPSAVGMRQRVYVMVAIALATLRTIRLEASREIIDAVQQHAVTPRTGESTVPASPATADELVLVDGASPLALVDPATTNLSVVAVVPQGIPRRRLVGLVSDYSDGGLAGVVLVKGRAGFRPTRSGGEALPASDAARAVRTTREVPEPERA